MTAIPPAGSRTAAPADGAPRVLLLHGLGGTASVWDRMTRQLGDRLALRDAELPWRGMAGTEWSTLDDPGRILADLADSSYDAIVAHSYAAGLLLEEYASGRITPRPTVLLSPFHRSRAEEFDWAAITYHLNDFHRVFEEALEVGEAGRYPDRHRRWLARQLRDQVGPYGWMRYFECYLRSPFVNLGAVHAPVLVLSGDRDVATPPEEGRALAAGLPQARFELIPDCGHFPMVERSEQVARLLDGFLVPSSAGRQGQSTYERP
ncbi:alpha/beta hydrolase (plasmid) [Streptomyces decoyicus]|uniref:alpha/beta fold hydrolase n=1 Tax=Streptomyces decoyicus TaxID=249567 RepID=UPI002E3483B6|nr:alpha/beta fold hydrolase [Streptomyces decoyicus]